MSNITITGTIKFDDKSNHEIVVQFEKLGSKVEGFIRFIGRDYYIRGRYNHDILTFYYYPKDTFKRSQGTATLQSLMDGKVFKGYFAYYSEDNDHVRPVEVELTTV